MMGIFETLFLVLVMMLVAFSLRVVPEQQRIAVFRFGRWAGLRGPGMVMVVPFIDRDCKIIIGSQGKLMSDGTGLFGAFRIPVKVSTDIAPGAVIRVVGFAEGAIQVA